MGRNCFQMEDVKVLLNLFVKKQLLIKSQAHWLVLYTCSPYTFVLGIHEQSFFFVDTHCIGSILGGNGNGILVVTKDCSLDSCKTLCQWIIKHFKCSGVVGTEYRSLVWLTILNGMFNSILIKLRLQTNSTRLRT